jgi:transcriptional regulator with XRE-family HTH domain
MIRAVRPHGEASGLTLIRLQPISIAMELVTIGERLRRARRARKMSQADLAPMFGVDQSTYSRWELGHIAIADRHVAAVADFLGESRRELVAELHPVQSAIDVPMAGRYRQMQQDQGRPDSVSPGVAARVAQVPSRDLVGESNRGLSTDRMAGEVVAETADSAAAEKVIRILASDPLSAGTLEDGQRILTDVLRFGWRSPQVAMSLSEVGHHKASRALGAVASSMIVQLAEEMQIEPTDYVDKMFIYQT